MVLRVVSQAMEYSFLQEAIMPIYMNVCLYQIKRQQELRKSELVDMDYI